MKRRGDRLRRHAGATANPPDRRRFAHRPEVQSVRRPCEHVFDALGIAERRRRRRGPPPGHGRRRGRPPLRRARGARHPLPRDPHQVGTEPRPGRVPAAVRVDGQPLRGCTHACVYCAAPETPVLLRDGRTRRIAELRVGDEIYGTVRDGTYRRYVATQVLAHWSTVKPAVRVTLEDGTELVASGDHRFLTGRGWKHVTGSEWGPLRRAHLTINDKLLGLGGFATKPTDDRDYRRGYLCGVIRGDGHVGSYADARGTVHRFRLALADLEALRRARAFLDDLAVVTRELAYASAGSRPVRAIRTQRRESVARVNRARRVAVVPEPVLAEGLSRRHIRRGGVVRRLAADSEHRPGDHRADHRVACASSAFAPSSRTRTARTGCGWCACSAARRSNSGSSTPSIPRSRASARSKGGPSSPPRSCGWSRSSPWASRSRCTTSRPGPATSSPTASSATTASPARPTSTST